MDAIELGSGLRISVRWASPSFSTVCHHDQLHMTRAKGRQLTVTQILDLDANSISPGRYHLSGFGSQVVHRNDELHIWQLGRHFEQIGDMGECGEDNGALSVIGAKVTVSIHGKYILNEVPYMYSMMQLQ